MQHRAGAHAHDLQQPPVEGCRHLGVLQRRRAHPGAMVGLNSTENLATQTSAVLRDIVQAVRLPTPQGLLHGRPRCHDGWRWRNRRRAPWWSRRPAAEEPLFRTCKRPARFEGPTFLSRLRSPGRHGADSQVWHHDEAPGWELCQACL